MTVPTPHQVSAHAAVLVALAPQVAEAYAALHDSGYRIDSAAESGGHRRRIAPDGSETGPTASVAAEREGARAKLEAAAKAVASSATAVQGALTALRRLGDLVDKAAGYSPDASCYPRDVDKAELADIVARQARRDAEASLVLLRRTRAEAAKVRAEAAEESRRAAAAAARRPGKRKGWRAA